MSWFLSRCPKCGAQIESSQVLAVGPFPCPHCQARIEAPESYGGWIGLGNLLISGGALWLCGSSGLHLVAATLLAWFPVQFVALRLVRYMVPPRLREYLPQDTTLRLRGGRDS